MVQKADDKYRMLEAKVDDVDDVNRKQNPDSVKSH